ncbi:hypothetical protein [Methylomarinum vadi]|uniref:hypothetical protein n=1 Tax=Methylomarinum vadi TaxID=438855 RepID=UPI0004DF5034|nr:hypothetical protein [Methylomarinum vadi]
MSLLAEHPNTIAKVLDSSFKLYLLSFRKLIGMALIIAAAAMVFNVVVQMTMPTLQNSGNDPAAMQSLPLLFGALLVYGLTAMILYVAMVYRIDNLLHENEDSFAEAIMLGVKKLPSMLWATILYMLALAVGSLLLVIPGIILWLSLAFFPYVLVVDGEGAYQSLKSSHQLVWGNWWRTMTVFMVPGIIIMIVFFMLGIIAGVTGSLVPQGFNWFDAVSNLFVAIYLPYFYCLGYVQYRDLKLRAYGGDLEARLAVQ